MGVHTRVYTPMLTTQDIAQHHHHHHHHCHCYHHRRYHHQHHCYQYHPMIIKKRLQTQKETPRNNVTCIICVDVYHRPVCSESLLGFGVSSGEFRDVVTGTVASPSAGRSMSHPRIPGGARTFGQVQEPRNLLYCVYLCIALYCV